MNAASYSHCRSGLMAKRNDDWLTGFRELSDSIGGFRFHATWSGCAGWRDVAKSHGLATGSDEALAQFAAAALLGVLRGIPDSEAFVLAADDGEAVGARTSEPELSADFFPERLLPDSAGLRTRRMD